MKVLMSETTEATDVIISLTSFFTRRDQNVSPQGSNHSFITELFFTFNLVNGFVLEGLRSEVSVAAPVSAEPPQEAAAV